MIRTLIFFLYSAVALSAETSYVGHNLVLSVFAQEGIWHSVLVRQEPGKIQELEFDRHFSTEVEAQAFSQSIIKKYDLGEAGFMESESPGFVTEDSVEAIWIAKNSWNWDWEIKYAQWVRKEVGPDYLKGNGVAVDCADVAYSMRWIFSRINSLPAAAILAGTNAMFTNESMKEEWKKLPTNEDWRKDQRFFAALDFMLNNTFTHTLAKILYPIKIGPEALMPGAIHLGVGGDTGHTLNFIRVEEDKMSVPLKVMWAGVPRAKTELAVGPFYVSWQPKPEEGPGISRFRWPVKVKGTWEIIPAEKMPYYSLEQYDPEFTKVEKNFVVAVIKRLFPDFEIKTLLQSAIDLLKQDLRRRVKIVNDGYEYCKHNNCSPGTEGWESYSTPSLDKRIRELVRDLEKFSYNLAALYNSQSQGGKDWEVWTKAWSDTAVNYKDKDISIREIAYIWTAKGFSSDPRVSLEQRWGIESESFVKNIKEKLQSLFNERQSKIAKNTCAKDTCPPNSEGWTNNNTYFLDNEIQYIGYVLALFCDYRDADSCSQFNQKMKVTALEAGGKKLNLSEWMKESLWLNSDPRWENDVRWGSLQNKLKYFYYAPSESEYLTDDGLLVRKFRDSSKVTITQVDSKKIYPWDEKLKFIDFDLTKQKILAREGDEVVVYHPRSGHKMRIAIPGSAANQVMWVGHNLVAEIKSIKTFNLYKILANKIEALGTFESAGQLWLTGIDINSKPQTGWYASGDRRAPPRYMILRENGERTFSVIDFQNPDQKRTSFAPGPEIGKYPANFYYIVASPTHHLVSVFARECEADTCKGKSSTLKIRKTDGKYSAVNGYFQNLDLYPYFGFKKDSAIKDPLQIVRINDDFSVQKVLGEFPGYQMADSHEKGFVSLHDQFGIGNDILLKINDDETLRVFKDEDRIPFSHDGSVVLSARDGGSEWCAEDFYTYQKFLCLPFLWFTNRSPVIGRSLKFAFGEIKGRSEGYFGIYQIGKFGQRPFLTGFNYAWANSQPHTYNDGPAIKYMGLPLFLGYTWDENVKVPITAYAFSRPIDTVFPFPKFSNQKGWFLYLDHNRGIWLE